MGDVLANALSSLPSDLWFESGWPRTDSQISADGNGRPGLLGGAIVFNMAPSIGANLSVEARVRTVSVWYIE